jgi:hypothetical protein
MWRRPLALRRIFPLPVLLKRFLAADFVFILGMRAVIVPTPDLIARPIGGIAPGFWAFVQIDLPERDSPHCTFMVLSKRNEARDLEDAGFVGR